MLLKTIALTTALLAAATGAFAADMPVKAPPKVNFTFPYSTSGWYIGAGGGGEFQKASVNAGGVGLSSIAAGGVVDALVGYSFALSPDRAIAAELIGSYSGASTNLSCGGAVACSFASRASVTAKVKYIGNIQSIIGFLPDLFGDFPTLPSVPIADGSNPSVHWYIGGYVKGADESAGAGILSVDKFQVTFGPTLGIITKLKSGGAIDTFAQVDVRATRFAVGSLAVADPSVKYSMGVHYLMGVSRY